MCPAGAALLLLQLQLQPLRFAGQGRSLQTPHLAASSCCCNLPQLCLKGQRQHQQQQQQLGRQHQEQRWPGACSHLLLHTRWVASGPCILLLLSMLLHNHQL
jgi:hypothetical protein